MPTGTARLGESGAERNVPARNYVVDRCEKCDGTTSWSRHCAAYVCDTCGHHQTLVRCYCGWSTSGRNGREELEALGETIGDVEEGC